MNDKDKIIECRTLSVFYTKHKALGPLNCILPVAQKIGVLGPNGAGKSTFLKAIVGLISYKGEIVRHYNNPVYTAQRHEVDWNFPITCIELVEMGLYRNISWFSRIKSKHKKTLQALDSMNMKDYANTPISNLSVGQQQRIFLARAMVDDSADLFIFDEPFAGIDIKSEQIINNLFNSLVDAGKTVLCVHHNLYTAADYFGYVLLLNQKLIAAGPVKRVLSPTNLQLAYGGGVVIPQIL